MKLLSVFLLATAFLVAGCAETHSTAMGAGPADRTVCKDGKTLPPHSKCGLDKGVQHP
jgi:hypothetical protein